MTLKYTFTSSKITAAQVAPRSVSVMRSVRSCNRRENQIGTNYNSEPVVEEFLIRLKNLSLNDVSASNALIVYAPSIVSLMC